MNRSLPNYIRTFRRKAGLSQEEVAFLLGHENGTTVLRHENDQRIPVLDTALAYAAIFQTDPRELFAGRFEVNQATIQSRARLLLTRSLSEERPMSAAKATFLRVLAEDDEPYFVPCDE